MAAGECVHTILHFFGRLIGKGDSQNVPGGHIPGDQVRDPRGNHPGFSAAGSRQDELRALGMKHRFPLGVV